MTTLVMGNVFLHLGSNPAGCDFFASIVTDDYGVSVGIGVPQLDRRIHFFNQEADMIEWGRKTKRKNRVSQTLWGLARDVPL